MIPYPSQFSGKGEGFPLDPALLPRISSKTFFFAPALDIHVAVDVLLAARPSLYWGYDACLDVAYPHFVCITPFRPSSEEFPLSVVFSICHSNHFMIELSKRVSLTAG